MSASYTAFTPIIKINLVCIELLHKHIEGVWDLFNQSHRVNSREFLEIDTQTHTFQESNF